MPDVMLDAVGPVIEATDAGHTVVSVILGLNPEARVEVRGAYLRVLSPRRCVLTKEALERALGRAFRLPGDLEPLMPAFRGLIRIDEGQVEWRFSSS